MRRAYLAGVVSVALSGCSGGGSGAVAAQDPIATQTPTAAVDPTPTAPADEHTLKGSETFVRTYITETNRAYATGDVTFLRARSAKECGTCANVIGSVSDVYSSGGKFVGAGETIFALQSLTAALQRQQRVIAVLSSQDSTVLSAQGKPTSRFKGRVKSPFVFTLRWQMDRWLVTAIQRSATQ